jgi:hypothetical protein
VHSAGTSSNGITRRLIGARRARFVFLALALALAAPSLTTPLTADDWLQQLIATGRSAELPGLPRHRLDMFSFAGHAVGGNEAAMDAGMFPWWTDTKVKLAFWRPLSSLTHLLDWTLWPRSPFLMHAHNLLWFGLAVWAAAGFYRRFCADPFVAGLATLLFAVDDAHGPALGWVANRNAMVALAVALPAVVSHDRWRRDGWRPGRWLGPALLGVGLLAGEAALATTAYLGAYAIHLEPGRWRDSWKARLWSLGPYVAVVVVWRAVYVALGYGTFASGIYLDPGSDPRAFALALPGRALWLLAGQLALPWSDLATLWPYISEHATEVALRVAAVGVAFVAALVWPLVRRDATARFMATGMLLAVVPICSTFPADRLLFFVGVGAMGLVALWIGQAPRNLFGRAGVAVLLLVHLVLAAPLALIRSRSMVSVDLPLRRVDTSLPLSADTARRMVVLVNPPGDFFAGYLPIRRAALGEPLPRFRWLGSGTQEITLVREDERTLRVAQQGGFLPHVSERMLRSAARPMHVGERVLLSGMEVEVLALTPDQRPAEARMRFAVPLEDPSLYWAKWGGKAYVPFAPPPVGERVTLPAFNFIESVFGK